MKPDAIIFDFDGVLLESEHAGNLHLADYLTTLGHPIAPEEAMARFTGLAGVDFIGAVEGWAGRALPEDFHAIREAEHARVMAEGLDPVAGAVSFVRSLPATLPRVIASSSSTDWIVAHLDHLGLRDAFGDKIFSGREHVVRGKPAPDIYLYAAAALGVAIEQTVIIEDSVVGATGAVASGAMVIGLCAGRHCGLGHAERLRDLGVTMIANDFAEVADFIRS